MLVFVLDETILIDCLLAFLFMEFFKLFVFCILCLILSLAFVSIFLFIQVSVKIQIFKTSAVIHRKHFNACKALS